MDSLPWSIKRSDLVTGDIVLFNTSGLSAPDHAGIYVGKGRFVHAPSGGKTVQLNRLDDGYWQRCFVEGKRPLAR
jgi:cell wall-associated NlpC family hydrolase